MGEDEKEIVRSILGDGSRPATLVGLRFDRVVVAVLGELRAFTEAEAPEGAAVIVTISAPIRLPAKTARDLKLEIAALFSTGAHSEDVVLQTNGNRVRLRLVKTPTPPPHRFIGFVHNPSAAPDLLMDRAQSWLAARA